MMSNNLIIPKEFYLEFKNKNQPDGECIAYSEKVDGLSEDAIHVIEYTEVKNIYQIGMIEEYKIRLASANDTIESQKKRIKELELNCQTLLDHIVNIQRIVAGVTDAERSK